MDPRVRAGSRSRHVEPGSRKRVQPFVNQCSRFYGIVFREVDTQVGPAEANGFELGEGGSARQPVALQDQRGVAVFDVSGGPLGIVRRFRLP